MQVNKCQQAVNFCQADNFEEFAALINSSVAQADVRWVSEFLTASPQIANYRFLTIFTTNLNAFEQLGTEFFKTLTQSFVQNVIDPKDLDCYFKALKKVQGVDFNGIAQVVLSQKEVYPIIAFNNYTQQINLDGYIESTAAEILSCEQKTTRFDDKLLRLAEWAQGVNLSKIVGLVLQENNPEVLFYTAKCVTDNKELMCKLEEALILTDDDYYLKKFQRTFKPRSKFATARLRKRVKKAHSGKQK